MPAPACAAMPETTIHGHAVEQRAGRKHVRREQDRVLDAHEGGAQEQQRARAEDQREQRPLRHAQHHDRRIQLQHHVDDAERDRSQSQSPGRTRSGRGSARRCRTAARITEATACSRARPRPRRRSWRTGCPKSRECRRAGRTTPTARRRTRCRAAGWDCRRSRRAWLTTRAFATIGSSTGRETCERRRDQRARQIRDLQARGHGHHRVQHQRPSHRDRERKPERQVADHHQEARVVVAVRRLDVGELERAGKHHRRQHQRDSLLRLARHSTTSTTRAMTYSRARARLHTTTVCWWMPSMFYSLLSAACETPALRLWQSAPDRPRRAREKTRRRGATSAAPSLPPSSTPSCLRTTSRMSGIGVSRSSAARKRATPASSLPENTSASANERFGQAAGPARARGALQRGSAGAHLREQRRALGARPRSALPARPQCPRAIRAVSCRAPSGAGAESARAFASRARCAPTRRARRRGSDRRGTRPAASSNPGS